MQPVRCVNAGASHSIITSSNRLKFHRHLASICWHSGAAAVILPFKRRYVLSLVLLSLFDLIHVMKREKQASQGAKSHLVAFVFVNYFNLIRFTLKTFAFSRRATACMRINCTEARSKIRSRSHTVFIFLKFPSEMASPQFVLLHFTAVYTDEAHGKGICFIWN